MTLTRIPHLPPPPLLERLSLWQKLLLLSGTGMLSLVVAVLIGATGIMKGVDGVSEIGRNRLPSILALRSLVEAIDEQRASSYEAAIWERDFESQAIFKRIGEEKHKTADEAQEAWNAYRLLPKSPREEALWHEFNQSWPVWRHLDEQVTELILRLSRNTDPALQTQLFQQYYVLGGQIHPQLRQAHETLQKLIEANVQRIETETRKAEEATRWSARAMTGVGVSAIALLLFLDIVIAISILRQMGGEPAEAVRLAHRIADGDLSMPVPVQEGNQTSLFSSLAHMQRNLRELFERLHTSERRFHSIFSNMSEGVALHILETGAAGLAVDYRILEVNQRFQDIMGMRREDVVGQLASSVYGTGMAPYLSTFVHVVETKEAANLEIYHAPLEKHFAVSVVPWEDRGFATIFTDITERKRAEEKLRQIAHYDALTQLPNRVLLADRLNQSMARAKRGKRLLALCYLDLDGFKPVNDLHGHQTGDLLLVEIAKRLKTSIRGEDTVARLGGDEFVVLLGNLANLDECEKGLNRILAIVATPYQIQGHQIVVSASAGVTLYPDDDADPDTLMRHADQAMYRAKQSGRNRYHLFDPAQDRRIQVRHEALSNIADALQRGEFRLFYQPKVNMRSHQVIGAEALIRWQHPERGLLPPSEFLPVMVNSELDVAVGDWVLKEALRQMEAWRLEGRTLKVSVNVSSKQLECLDFARKLHLALGNYPYLGSGALELEILESAALEDMAHVNAIIGHFNYVGVSFALDDFGTGYSSLSYLKRLPAKTLKIDQTFVRNMLNDPED